jgi:hypothetical protein
VKNLPLFLGINVFTYNVLITRCVWSFPDTPSGFFVMAWVLADIAMISIILGLIVQEKTE